MTSPNCRAVEKKDLGWGWEESSGFLLSSQGGRKRWEQEEPAPTGGRLHPVTGCCHGKKG